MFEFSIEVKVFLAVLVWAVLFNFWRKEKSESQYLGDVLTIIACTLIGILTYMLNK
jgi:hypothetical protein